jgi:hypothetical protein
VENVVISWDMGDAPLNEQSCRDFVLTHPSRVGPWLTLGLGVIVIAFLGYLVSGTLLLAPAPASSSEYLLRPEGMFLSPQSQATRSPARLRARRQPTGPVIPHNRPATALLGGQGPAFPLDLAAMPTIPPSPPVSP